MSDFHAIKTAVASKFNDIAKGHKLFCVNIDKDILWQSYLASFPPGSDPIYRKRTSHDCSCCRSFVKRVGDVVAIVDNQLVSIWDIGETGNETYDVVATTMSKLVHSHSVDRRFYTTERTAGVDRTFEELTNSAVATWDHFFVNIPIEFVCKKIDIGPKQAEDRAHHEVLLRSLKEITQDSVDTVLDLTAQKSIYRGEEHLFAITEFRKLKEAFINLPITDHNNFVWTKSIGVVSSITKIRNTAIGSLLTAISNGEPIDDAVKSFERMVAPANYKRPTALVTKAMVDKARDTLSGLGLTSALDRRYATLSDVPVTDVLFADRSVRGALRGDVFDDIAGAVAVKPKAFDKIEEVGIEDFLTKVLPRAITLEILVENRLTGNLVSLIAPGDPTANSLFKWDNKFSWSYSGDLADSVKERVKRAGGNVTGEVCCRLAWYNQDDLDLHLEEPYGDHFYYGNKNSPNGGHLDVDMNVNYPVRNPVVNIFYPTTQRMPFGHYTVFVNQYNKRESSSVGFEVELDLKGALHSFFYDKSVRLGESVEVAVFNYVSNGFTLERSLPSTTVSKLVWGVQTETFRRVNVVMRSPNYWSGHGVGNLHHFFMLDGCVNDGTARGFYNEFLKSELDPHRKVFELVGSRVRAEESSDQLSGLGFSSTQRNHVVAKVTGASTRTIKVMF